MFATPPSCRPADFYRGLVEFADRRMQYYWIFLHHSLLLYPYLLPSCPRRFRDCFWCALSAADSRFKRLKVLVHSFNLQDFLTQATFLALTRMTMGVAVQATRSFNPFLIVGSVVAAVGSGLLILLHAAVNLRAWISYQASAGIGLGLCLTTPIIVTQRVCTQENISSATAVILCESKRDCLPLPR